MPSDSDADAADTRASTLALDTRALGQTRIRVLPLGPARRNMTTISSRNLKLFRASCVAPKTGTFLLDRGWSTVIEGDSSMRRQMSLAVLAAVSALTVGGSATPAPAEAIQDRYCLQGRQWGYPGNCLFSTYQQCMATASGTNAYCGINPLRAFAHQRRGRYRDRY